MSDKSIFPEVAKEKRSRFSQRSRFFWPLLPLFLLACGLPVNELDSLVSSPPASTAVPDEPPPATVAPPASAPATLPATAVVSQQPLSLDLELTIPVLAPGATYLQPDGGERLIQLRLPPDALNQSLLLLANPEEGLDVALTLRTTAGGTIVEVDERGAGEPELIPFTAVADENYELIVSPINETAAPYTVTILDIANREAAFVDTTAVLENTDVGRHDLEAEAGEAFFILLEPDTALDPLLELYAPGGFLVSEDSGSVAETESLVFVAPETATYQIVVFPFGTSSGAYRLRVVKLTD